VISVWVPAGAPARQREGVEPPPAAASSGTVQPTEGAVEGFTWQ
jgi:hypothetical protein